MEKKDGFLFKDEDSNDTSNSNNQNTSNVNGEYNSGVNNDISSSFKEMNSHVNAYEGNEHNEHNNSNGKENINNSSNENSFGNESNNIQGDSSSLNINAFQEKFNSISSSSYANNHNITPNNNYGNQNTPNNNLGNQNTPNNNLDNQNMPNNNLGNQNMPNNNFDNQNLEYVQGGYVPPKKKSKAPIFIITGFTVVIIILLLFLLFSISATSNANYLYENSDESELYDDDYSVDDYTEGDDLDLNLDSDFNTADYALLSNLEITSSESEYPVDNGKEYVNVEFDLKNVGIEEGIDVGSIYYSMELCYNINDDLTTCNGLKDYVDEDDTEVSDLTLNVGDETHINLSGEAFEGSSNFYIKIQENVEGVGLVNYESEKVNKS